jgi:hypothetical protein
MKRARGTLTAEARRLEGELADFARRLHRRMFGTDVPFPEEMKLSLDVFIPPRPEDDAESAPALLSQISKALRQTGSRVASVVPGRVFCYRCDRADCEHSAPPRPQSVFAGFSPTGQPQWEDFAQALLEARHERVDDLFAELPAVLGLVQAGRDLKARLLHPFGKSSKTYDVLGQIVAGHFAGPGAAPCAVTVQAIESRNPDGRTRLTLNRIGVEAAEFFDAHPEHAFAIALKSARLRLAQIEEELGEGAASPSRRSELMRKVPGILHDLRRVLERAGRQRQRRTKHAAERRLENRPTQAALRDAWSASDADLLADETRGTLIVLGPHGRAHAFTPAGRHVTSLILDREALSRRIARKRWRPATPAEIEGLRTALPARS